MKTKQCKWTAYVVMPNSGRPNKPHMRQMPVLGDRVSDIALREVSTGNRYANIALRDVSTWRQELDADGRESRLRERLKEVASTLERVSRNAELRQRQASELATELKTANR
ncbi:hypothetical protein J6590_074100 [Homalodisca vitripennis]|nr:hypothetical protein J6590_074100 [Homalodisca vitripennis]